MSSAPTVGLIDATRVGCSGAPLTASAGDCSGLLETSAGTGWGCDPLGGSPARTLPTRNGEPTSIQATHRLPATAAAAVVNAANVPGPRKVIALQSGTLD